MKTVKIFENWTQNNGTYFTLQKPRTDLAEKVEISEYIIPEGYEVAVSRDGVKRFYNVNDSSFPALMIEQNGKLFLIDDLKIIELRKTV